MRHLFHLLVLLICGCASTEPVQVSFDSTSGTTTYATVKVPVGHRDMGGGLAAGQRLVMQAFASCRGDRCTPHEVDLAFLNDSGTDLNIDYRRIQVHFDGNTFDWEDVARRNESPGRTVPRGEFLRISLPVDEFSRLAEAPTVEILFGLTGTSAFRLPHDRREPLRNLAQRFD